MACFLDAFQINMNFILKIPAISEESYYLQWDHEILLVWPLSVAIYYHAPAKINNVEIVEFLFCFAFLHHSAKQQSIVL